MTNGKHLPKPRTAVALSYEPQEQAPRVIAAGKGLIADRIIERAKDADVPLHKDEQLASHLSKLELGSFIPPEAYEIVAEILTFVDRIDRIKGKIGYNSED